MARTVGIVRQDFEKIRVNHNFMWIKQTFRKCLLLWEGSADIKKTFISCVKWRNFDVGSGLSRLGTLWEENI